ncbi:hypothetical protein SAMN03159423_2945 [Bradyrhizobium sp. NFR13]|jgi:hypothetical protein|uniref:hypothetical protein n=1 Tax=Bradyrhizobium sp. NFR13 TaxID=1566285 RepID=UPI0008EF05D0|nr:hypothetical protein [Bradyrhizobium sp. NFR13]SFL62914.1 hypothetical protein SAMN03159423_2945 [Bradyrhizobium sp. NFR13]
MSSAIDNVDHAKAYRRKIGNLAPAADWLCLAAAPAFALMALLTGVLDGSSPDLLCLTSHSSPWSGMAVMYAFMSLFHTVPWLRLISGRYRQSQWRT